MKKLLVIGLALMLAGCGGAVVEGGGLSVGIAPTPIYAGYGGGGYYHRPYWGGGGYHHRWHRRGW